MRLPYIVMIVVSTLSGNQLPVTASVSSDIAQIGVMSLGFLRLVSADQSDIDKSRFLRRNYIGEGNEEERGIAEGVQKMTGKDIVNKIVRNNSFSALWNVDDLTKLNQISAAADEHLISVFKFADNAKMGPSDLATHLKNIDGVDDYFAKMAVRMYIHYLNGLNKAA